MNKIPQTTIDAWLPLLEGGTLEQTTGNLCRDPKGSTPGYCCLGVFALSQGATFEPEMVEGDDGDGTTIEGDDVLCLVAGQDINDSELLDPDWADQFGIGKEHQTLLSTLNDGGSVIVANNDPRYNVFMKVATGSENLTSEGEPILLHTKVAAGEPARVFYFAKHTFAQIAAIIREHLS